MILKNVILYSKNNGYCLIANSVHVVNICSG